MVSNFDGEWLGKQRRQPEDERKKMQEAFDHFHTSKEWGMICMIHEVDGFLDIVIRFDREQNTRGLCGVCWNKAHLTSEQLAQIQEKIQELELRKNESTVQHSPEKQSRQSVYQWGIIDNWMCRDGVISASSPEEAERMLRNSGNVDATITVFY